MLSSLLDETDDERIAWMARAIATRGYTDAELRFAAGELPFDPKASHNYGRGLNLADLERHVQRLRVAKVKLQGLMTMKEVSALCQEFPDDLSLDSFHKSSYNSFNEPLYRYAPGVKRFVPEQAVWIEHETNG